MYIIFSNVNHNNGDKMQKNKYKMRTDLAIEDIKLYSDNMKKYKNIDVIDITLNSREAKIIGKRKGRYITIQFDNIRKNYDNILKVLNEELESIIAYLKIKNNDSCLVIGLGNEKLIYDSLGPKTVDKLLITSHLKKNKYRKVSSFIPNVISSTGIDTAKIVEGITNIIKPDFVIIIDSLMSKNIDRLNKTIQITDSGIIPGSALGNKKAISSSTLNIPVISIGVPFTLDIYSIFKNISYKKIDSLYEKFYKNGMTIITNDIDYLVDRFSSLISSSLNDILHK